ncbi:MAG: DivIVA domain-containing protein [Oscillospiraceae bacterium]|jgi:cell division initiation protein|nr:DivIVA domain-containing protein [Oscillospiraceae bacterium]
MFYVPEDLEGLTLHKSFLGGYRQREVDAVMRKITNDYREKERELEDLKSQVSVMKETVQHYKTIEESMQHCLIIAQHTSDEMIHNADSKAKEILAQADSTSQKVVEDAYRQANQVKLSYENIKAQISSFKLKSAALLKSQLDVLNQLDNESKSE